MPKAFTLRVSELIPRTHNVLSVRFLPQENIPFKAGQFLRLSLGADDTLRRYLSISNSPTDGDYIECTKKITDSDFSKRFLALKPGDAAGVEYPFGTFVLKSGYKKVAFISGGIGITPIRGICKYALDSKLDVDIVLIYANRSAADIAFKEDFEKMQKASPSLRVEHILCEAAPDFTCTIGRVNADIIKDKVSDFSERIFFLCGPPPMVSAMKTMLQDELKVAQDRIVTENFQGY